MLRSYWWMWCLIYLAYLLLLLASNVIQWPHWLVYPIFLKQNDGVFCLVHLYEIAFHITMGIEDARWILTMNSKSFCWSHLDLISLRKMLLVWQALAMWILVEKLIWSQQYVAESWWAHPQKWTIISCQVQSTIFERDMVPRVAIGAHSIQKLRFL